MRNKWAKATVITFLILLPLIIGLIYRKSADALYRKLTGYPAQIVILAGAKGGLYRELAERLKTAIESDLDVDVQLEATSGSLENLTELQAGKAHFTLYQPGTLEVLTNHDREFASDVTFVVNLYSQPAHFIVRRGADIDRPADLAGKRVQLGMKESGDYAMSLILLEHFGLDEEKDIDAQYLTYAEVKQGFESDTLDAAFVTIGIQAPILRDLFATEKCRLLSIPHVDALTANHISASTYKIPKGLYRTQPPVEPAEDIDTVALGAQLLTRKDVSAALVSEVTSLVLNEDFLRRNHLGELFRNGREFARQQPEFAIHQGARSVYDPEFDIHIFEGWEALYSLTASILIAIFFGVRALRHKAARKKEHRLDRYVHSLLAIEQRQLALDSDPRQDDTEALQQLLDEVSFLRQEALSEFTAHELNEDRALDSFVQMCHALSSKINSKMLRQRLNQCIERLANALAGNDAGTRIE